MIRSIMDVEVEVLDAYDLSIVDYRVLIVTCYKHIDDNDQIELDRFATIGTIDTHSK